MPRLAAVAETLLMQQENLLKKPLTNWLLSSTGSTASTVPAMTVDSWPSMEENNSSNGVESPSLTAPLNVTFTNRVWCHQPYVPWAVLPPQLPCAAQCMFESYHATPVQKDQEKKEKKENRDSFSGPLPSEAHPPRSMRVHEPSERTRVVGKPPIVHSMRSAEDLLLSRSTTPVASPKQRPPMPRSQNIQEDMSAVERIRDLGRLMLYALRSVTIGPVTPQRRPQQLGETVFVYRVQHKRRATFAWSTVPYHVSSVVIVDGDQGLDIGEVTRVIETPFTTQKELPTGEVYRLATEQELGECLSTTKALEEAALSFLVDLSTVAKTGNLTEIAPQHQQYAAEVAAMSFTDVELQADHKKLYIYFTAPRTITFCHLTRALFKMYRCRVWLHQANLNNNMSNESCESYNMSITQEQL